MKQLNFLVVAFTLLIGISLTSCLGDSDEESAWDGGGMVRVMYGSYFVDLEGNTYYPTTTSLTQMKEKYGYDITSADLSVIYFKYVENTNSTTKATATNPQRYTIQLVSAMAIESASTTIVNTIEEMEEYVPETASVVTLKPTDSYGQTSSPSLYGNQMLVLPIQWLQENKSETIAQHSFTLVYVSGETDDNATEMVVYLRHDKGTDTKRETSAVRVRAFDINYMLSSFKEKTGAYPTKLTIKARTSSANSEETLPEDYSSFDVDCKILENYN